MTSTDRLAVRARRRYEFGRAGRALPRALLAAGIAALGLAGCAPPTVSVVCVVALATALWACFWRGSAWGRGARIGWAAGLLPGLTPATIRLTQDHCALLCEHLMIVCVLCGVGAGAVVATYGLKGGAEPRFLAAAGGTAVLVGMVGCIPAGLAAAVGMALAVSLIASAPLLASHRT